MIFEDFNPKIHDTFKIANLMYDVDFRTYDIFFKTKNKAILVIKKGLDSESKSKYYKMKIILSSDSRKIIGFLSYYTKKISFLDETFYLFKSLGFLNGFKIFLIYLLDLFVLADFTSDDVYLSEFAIDSSKRGQGLGEKVLTNYINHFKNKGYKKLILDVDFRNTKAKSLYEKLGFKVFNKKKVKIFTFTRGMYNMELVLN